ncbi:response regulator [Alkalihalobacillus deserti]|uniref:response regulator n=1 Tax=Alkalihalobacillus deserti TaxID=2879466 RepID=UPI001D15E243|nr:response regulator [Alkalihalobacillus deserti]
MKLKTKLILGLGTIAVIIIALSVTVFYTLDKQNNSMREIFTSDYNRLILVNELNNEMNVAAREARELLLVSSESKRTEKVKNINQAMRNLSGIFTSLERITLDDEKLQQISSVQALQQSYGEIIQNVINIATTDGVEAGAEYLMNNGVRQELAQELNTLIAMEEQTIGTAFAATEQTYENAVTIVTILIAISISAVIVIVFLIVKNISKSINGVRKVITSVSSHSLDQLPRIKVTTKDEIGDISSAYNEMAEALENISKKEKQVADALKDENWIKSRYAEVAMKFQGVRELNEFGRTLMTNIAQFVKATHGVIYLRDETTKLKKLASFASAENGEEVGVKTIHLGQGLVGQCASDKQMMNIEPLPKGYIATRSGLGEATPTSLILIPIEFNGEVLGVLELAKFQSFTKPEITILEQVCRASGSSIERILHHMKLEELLAESQTQSEELQTQSEELQQQQEELRLTNDQLHEQYKQSDRRKKELERIKEDLEHKNRSIKLGSRYKSEFLANMSHELRTPLNSMLILSQLLAENKNENLTEKQVEHANTIYSSGTDLLDLINDILDLSKIESGKVEVSPEEVSIVDVKAFVERQFMPISNQKGVDFKINIEQTAPSLVFTDDQRLKQILKNLLSNAFKFTSNGSVELYVKKGLENGEMKVSFSVIDTGIGISEEKQQQIFDAFYQEDGTITRSYGGTGLGLSISRELSQLLGGYIEVESVINQGSTFTLHIPDLNGISVLNKVIDEVAVSTEDSVIVQESKGNNPNLEKETAEQKQTNKIELQGKCVLIVDDDMRNVFALTTALEEQNMKVLFAENGKEALKLLEKKSMIDIVLMDIMMPEMNGYEAMEMIRKNKEWIDLPIIALTAKAMKNDREKCITAGASDYISKPVNMKQLLSLIKVWLHK